MAHRIYRHIKPGNTMKPNNLLPYLLTYISIHIQVLY
nr:MAG TPA: hypothetical protein [Caudoviricetes sp.]